MVCWDIAAGIGMQRLMSEAFNRGSYLSFLTFYALHKNTDHIGRDQVRVRPQGVGLVSSHACRIVGSFVNMKLILGLSRDTE